MTDEPAHRKDILTEKSRRSSPGVGCAFWNPESTFADERVEGGFPASPAVGPLTGGAFLSTHPLPRPTLQQEHHCPSWAPPSHIKGPEGGFSWKGLELPLNRWR